MSNVTQLVQDFLAALAGNNPAQYEAVLSEEVGMRLNRWDGREVYRPRKRVMQRFIDEWSSWPDPHWKHSMCWRTAIGLRWSSAFRRPKTSAT